MTRCKLVNEKEKEHDERYKIWRVKPVFYGDIGKKDNGGYELDKRQEKIRQLKEEALNKITFDYINASLKRDFKVIIFFIK